MLKTIMRSQSYAILKLIILSADCDVFKEEQLSHMPCTYISLISDFLLSASISAQNTRGRWAIRPRELQNRPRQVAHGGDCKIKNRPGGIIK